MTEGHDDARPDDARPDAVGESAAPESVTRASWQPAPDQPDEPWWAAPAAPAAAAAAPNEPTGQPAHEQPAHEQPAYQQPAYQQPSHRQPTYGQPTYGQPTYGQATYGQPAYGQASYGQPAYGQPGARRRERGGKGWPSLLVVAVVAALIGAGVGSGVVAATKKTSSSAPPAGATETNPPVAQTSLPSGAAATGSVASVAAALLPSVVSIYVTGSDEADEGTGIILSADGQILTNNHVVEAAASSGVIAVTFSDGHTVSASIVGRDPTSDLAVIKAASTTDLHPASLGSDASLAVGQQVVAVGSPLGLSNTVTAGIVSSLNRPVCTQNCAGSGGSATPTVLDAIQTDAAINPGNSGGPLVDMAGRVVGINSAIATLDQQQSDESQSGNIGVGFAIPIDEARRIITELQTTGHADHALFGIGVADSLDTKLNTPNGAKIVSVTPGGPADKAGLRVGDIVVKFGNRPLVDADSLIAATHAADPNSTVTITYMRNGQQATAQVTLSSASSG
jgi:putative serine protease PepD